MILKANNALTELEPILYQNINQIFGQNEKNLEEALSMNIGNVIFPEYFVFGNERLFQREADIFALNRNGDLVVFELKVQGEYDRGKIYQALDYAQSFSNWQYEDMNSHYKKCFPNQTLDLCSAFENHFGFKLDLSKYNREQKIIVISNGSSIHTRTVAEYWKNKGIDIEEYYYRIYQIGSDYYFELSTELYVQTITNDCWINTCEKYIQGAYVDMVKNHKASAYGNMGWVIQPSMKSSYVFLYLNGYGIIAAGLGTASIQNNGLSDDEYEQWINLDKFIHGVDLNTEKVLKSIPASIIKKELNRDFWFATTKVPLTKEEAAKLYSIAEQTFA